MVISNGVWATNVTKVFGPPGRAALVMLSATSIHGSQHRGFGDYSRAYESSSTGSITFADRAALSARNGMGMVVVESSDSAALLGSGRDSK
jgi:hypothetical protein